MASVPSDLSKLTVPQLKALCKERRITGYSKLSKAALLQRLAEVASPTKTTSPPSVPSIPHADKARNPAYIVSGTASREENVTKVVHQPSTESTEAPTAKALLPAQLPKSPQNRIVTSTRETSAKRPAHIDTSVPPKRIKTSLKPATNASHEPLVPTPTLQEKWPVDASVFKVPDLPVQPQRSFHGSASTLAKRPAGIKPSVVSHQITGAGRFKPLVSATPKPVEHEASGQPSRAPAVSVTPRGVDSTLDFNFHATPLPVLSHITFPPKASERKLVYRWAIVLSALSPADRQTCMLVSRTFRYAGRKTFSVSMFLRHVGSLPFCYTYLIEELRRTSIGYSSRAASKKHDKPLAISSTPHG